MSRMTVIHSIGYECRRDMDMLMGQNVPAFARNLLVTSRMEQIPFCHHAADDADARLASSHTKPQAGEMSKENTVIGFINVTWTDLS